MNLATVVQIHGLNPHPNADRLELIFVDYGGLATQMLVVGKHYREGDLGIYIPAGALIPGYLAHQEMWLAGRGKAMEWFPIVAKNMRGIESPGIFSGQYYKHDRERDAEWTKWSYWCDWWKVGDDVAAYLGIRGGDYGSAPDA